MPSSARNPPQRHLLQSGLHQQAPRGLDDLVPALRRAGVACGSAEKPTGKLG